MVNNLTDAIKEAYATAPDDEIIYETLELLHPNFLDEDGQVSSIRVVRGFNDLSATLESTAPLNPGEEVVFMKFAFDIRLPDLNNSADRQFHVIIDNVSSLISENLDRVKHSGTKIRIIYRPYLLSDLSRPQLDPPFIFTLRSVTVDELKVTGVASFELDLTNRSFPRENYKVEVFKGLIQ